MLGLYGAYQDGIAKDTVDGKDVAAHLFEYTTQVVVDSKGTVSGGIAPVQVCFVVPISSSITPLTYLDV